MSAHDTDESFAEFYAPILGRHPRDVQKMLARLLNSEFKQPADLADAIMLVASESSTEEETQ